MRSRLLAFALFAAACGTSPASSVRAPSRDRAKIIGGIDDPFRTYVVGVGDATSGVFCTGTLISARTVLTAGHCYDPSKANGGISRIFFGQNLDVSPTIVQVAQAIRHPNYNDTSLDHDITMVQLAADAPSQAVPLLRETMDNSPDFVGPRFTFAGYGNDGHSNYDQRRVVTFPIAAVGPANVGTQSGTGPIDATQFYYDVSGKNTCDGDSGGPGFVVRNGVERLAGSTSYGDSACRIDGVDARTDAPEIALFIQPTLDAFEPNNACRADGTCNESCNTNGQLGDPDCADAHCGADGICVLSCSPVDPDCTGVDHCGADGICDPSCATTDDDCLPPPDAGPATSGSSSSGSTGSGSSSSSSSGSTGSSSSSSSSSGSTGSGSSSSGSTGSGSSSGSARAGTSSGSTGGEGAKSGGCGAGGSGAFSFAGLLALGLLVSRRRR